MPAIRTPRCPTSKPPIASAYRTHVRNLMNDAQAAGLVRIGGRGGRSITILPRFWASYDRGLAVGMYLHDAVNLVAMRQWTKQHTDTGATALLDRTSTAPV